MNSKRAATGALLVASLVAAALYFGPHWTVYRMRQAIDARDATSFSSHVDFPSLKESFKAQLLVRMTETMAAPQMRDNPFAGLGQMIAVGMINQMVDAYVSPAGVMLMMKEGKPKIEKGVPAASAPTVVEERAAPSYAINYADWSTAVIRSKDLSVKAGFVLKRDGLFAWRLAAVELPM